MTGTHGHAATSSIDKRDFDAHRPLLGNTDAEHAAGERASRPASRRSRISALAGSDDGLLSDVVEGIVERDRRKLQMEFVRVCSFAWGVVSWYVRWSSDLLCLFFRLWSVS